MEEMLALFQSRASADLGGLGLDAMSVVEGFSDKVII